MRKVNRKQVAEPAVLSRTFSSDNKTELERAADFIAKTAGEADPKKRGKFEFTRYSSAEVKTALEQLFHGKCAYCESAFGSTQPVDVEHYRPKGEVEGVPGHRGYWWLAMDWKNLLPSCIDCNRRRNQKLPKADSKGRVLLELGDFDRSISLNSGKESAFPVTGTFRAMERTDDYETEGRLLLDPTRDNPDDHLVFFVDRNHLVSLVYPKPGAPGVAAALPDPDNDPSNFVAIATKAGVSVMGMVSIQIYGLNRLGLVQTRTKVLRDMEFLLAMSLNLEEVAAELGDRLAEKKKRLPMLSESEHAALVEDIASDQRIAKKIRRYVQEMRDRIREQTLPKAPYSRLAKAWIEAYLQN
ncbi:MAG: endonuclease [Mesorhizobium sp.]|uniref:hypothetical protein n=1 Tax=Mesorhizobium sp. TaxID=1871066 RepID=UPI000FE54D3E|nr:hypothetical protein [Mesorhizobium sp.]RWP42958.1 MAG: endonuclease [Mesorhizobium sp.]